MVQNVGLVRPIDLDFVEAGRQDREEAFHNVTVDNFKDKADAQNRGSYNGMHFSLPRAGTYLQDTGTHQRKYFRTGAGYYRKHANFSVLGSVDR